MSLLLAVWWQSVNKYAPKEKRPQTCLRAALAGFVALIETIRAKRKRVLRRVYNASLFYSVPFVHYKYSVFLFFSLLPIFLCVFLSRVPHGVLKFARVFTGVVEVIRRPLLS